MRDGWSDFATGDFCTHMITPVLVSLATAVIAGGITRRKEEKNRCNNAFLDEVKRHVVVIRELSDRATAEVLVQLTGNPTISFKHSLQQVGTHVRGVGMNVEILKIYLPPEVLVALENASYKWANDLCADPYPMQKKSNALHTHDPHLKEIQTAHVEWQKYLSRFVMECTTGKINLKAN
jgi:hypothetical protein